MLQLSSGYLVHIYHPILRKQSRSYNKLALELLVSCSEAENPNECFFPTTQVNLRLCSNHYSFHAVRQAEKLSIPVLITLL